MLPPVGDGIVSPLPGEYILNENTNADVAASNTEFWTFNHWLCWKADGTTFESVENPSYLYMNGNRKIQAYFDKVPIDPKTVSVTITGDMILEKLNEGNKEFDFTCEGGTVHVMAIDWSYVLGSSGVIVP